MQKKGGRIAWTDLSLARMCSNPAGRGEGRGGASWVGLRESAQPLSDAHAEMSEAAQGGGGGGGGGGGRGVGGGQRRCVIA